MLAKHKASQCGFLVSAVGRRDILVAMRSLAATGAILLVAAACASSANRVPDVPGAETNPALVRVAKQCALVASCADAHDSSAFRTPEACFDWYVVVNARDEAPLA